VFHRNTHAEGKLVSLFETGYGNHSQRQSQQKLVKIQEAENQIITAYEVCDQRPSDGDLRFRR